MAKLLHDFSVVPPTFVERSQNVTQVKF